jgi:ubiquinone/menaquinone biosynthesis C-methylase UbiE
MDLFGRFAQRRRRQIARLMLDTMRPAPGDTCLELGGPIVGLTGVVEHFETYVTLNIDPAALELARGLPSHQAAALILGDATDIPLKDTSIDYVFSNALLEHVPRDRRPLLAQEIRRVSRKGFFLSAPNYWFPLEPHYYMPFFQFLPESFKRALTKQVTMGWMSRETYEPVWLPSKRDLRQLFPQAHVTGLSFTGVLSETIVAWQRFDDI